MESRTFKVLAHVYVQVLIGVVAGLALGVIDPKLAVELKPLADAFVKLIKMCVGPVVFFAVVHGINSAGNLQTAGRVGLKALIYFEVMTTFAMLIGWGVGELLQPGAGLNIHPSDLDPAGISAFTGSRAAAPTAGPTWMAFIPVSLFDPFVHNDIIQLLVMAVFGGIALLAVKEQVPQLNAILDQVMQWLFGIMRMVTRLAPLAAFGAIGFTVGKFGIASLLPLMKLVLAYYVGVAVFIVAVLWTVLRWCRVGLVEFLRYIREEIVIVFGTITSEAVMPRLITKLEYLGCKPDVVRIVLPTAYSFNLDGTALYLVLAPLFIAQALNLDLSWADKLSLFVLLMLTSKGAAGVTGGVLVTLVSTMLAHPIVPAAGLAITLGVDRFLNEGRAVVNLVGNAVATVAIARWDGSLNTARVRAVLEGRVPEYDENALDEPSVKASIVRRSQTMA
ncbi:cation:dicarboxylate symporter family transporter [Bradyrhizobium mercantei]|uniref:cation:dicarboxylate symporter family transporter n=1 Tax=Bradyrhizobium mercantei TaxID=1904807 RepID=UPI0009761989|nr:cation:dicarboxylase symporter family transporter [Bradyrhizobium mercantei]